MKSAKGGSGKVHRDSGKAPKASVPSSGGTGHGPTGLGNKRNITGNGKVKVHD